MKAAAAIINFVVLTAAASALNSYMYSAGRHFYQLALDSPNSKFMRGFRKISRTGVPARGILFSAALVLIGPILNSLPQISNAFTFITSVSSDLYIIVYLLTMLAHRKYRQSRDFDPQGFLMPAYKFTSPLVIGFFTAIYISLFITGDGVLPAIGGLVWTVGFIGVLTLAGKKKVRSVTDNVQ
jgi:AAT family amino acid transporter